MGENTALTLAILRAYEQVGDAGTLADVEKLANVRSLKIRRVGKMLVNRLMGARAINTMPRSEIPKVAAAAAECLRQSAERRASDTELLRPVEADHTAADTLLRPTAAQNASDPPDELLRPSEEALS